MKTFKTFNTLAALASAVALFAAHVPADARMGQSSSGGSRGAISAPSRQAAPARPAAVPTRTGSTSRMAQGRDSGVQREEANRQAREAMRSSEASRSAPPSRVAEAPAPVAPAFSGSHFDSGRSNSGSQSYGGRPYGNDALYAERPQQSKGVGMAGIAGAVAGGALLGHLLTKSDDRQAQPAAPAAPAAGVASLGSVAPSSQDGRSVNLTNPVSASPLAPSGSATSLTAADTPSGSSNLSAISEQPFGISKSPSIDATHVLVGAGLLVLLGVLFMLVRSMMKKEGHGGQTAPAKKSASKSWGSAGFPMAIGTSLGSSDSGSLTGAELEQDLLQNAPDIYRRAQAANDSGDVRELQRYVEEGDLLDELVSDIKSRSEAVFTDILTVRTVGGVLDFRRFATESVGSVLLRVTLINADGCAVDEHETWHFVRKSGSDVWKVNGITFMDGNE